MIKENKRSPWRCRMLWLLPVLLFSVAAALDLIVQHVEPLPLFNVVALFARGVRFGLFAGGLAFACGRVARFVYVPIWVWFAFIVTVEAVANLNFGTVLDGYWLAIAVGSSSQEIKTVLGKFSLPVLLPVLAMGSVAVYAGGRFLWRMSYPRPNWKSAGVALLLAIPFVAFDLSSRTRLGAFDALMAWHFASSTVSGYHSLVEVADSVQNPRLPAGLRMTDQAMAFPPIGMIVVGESATREHWQIYGYERPTTPCLADMLDELVVFREPTSSHGNTSMSLKTVFTDATRESPDVTRCMYAQKCAAVGYDCRLFSAQERWGRWEGVEKLVFTGCSYSWHLQDHCRGESSRKYDDALIEPIRACLVECSTNRAPCLVFTHLMGSHFDPQDRYPPEAAVFPRYSGDFAPGLDAESRAWNVFACNVYDNSIRFTDGILARLIEAMKSLRRPAYLVYFSDHGETPRARSWRMQGDPALLRVPLVVWLSPEYAKAFPETATQVKRRAESPIRLDHLQDELLLPLAQIVH